MPEDKVEKDPISIRYMDLSRKVLIFFSNHFVMMKLQPASLQLVIICKAYLLYYPILIEYTFSASLSTEERAYVHASAQALGMKSKSQGYIHEKKNSINNVINKQF